MSAETMYLIRKHGLFYRPNSEGYTACVSDAGRYTLAEAEEITHPNGPNGSRDGMDFIEAPSTRPSEPVTAPAVGGDGVLEDLADEIVSEARSADSGTEAIDIVVDILRRAKLAPPTPPGRDREVEAVASAVRSFAEAVLHGDDEHRGWLIEAAECFVAGNSLPEARGKGASQAAVEAVLADRDATIAKLKDALREAREEREQTKRERDEANSIAHAGFHEKHAMLFKKAECAEAKRADLVAALANLTDAFLSRHGCFPLDRTSPAERQWNAAMTEAYRLVGQPDTDARDAALRSGQASASGGEVGR